MTDGDDLTTSTETAPVPAEAAPLPDEAEPKPARKRTRKATPAPDAETAPVPDEAAPAPDEAEPKPARKRTRKATPAPDAETAPAPDEAAPATAPNKRAAAKKATAKKKAATLEPADEDEKPARKTPRKKAAPKVEAPAAEEPVAPETASAAVLFRTPQVDEVAPAEDEVERAEATDGETADPEIAESETVESDEAEGEEEAAGAATRRRRRRGGRRRRKSDTSTGADEGSEEAAEATSESADDASEEESEQAGESTSSRRRRRRRRSGDDGDDGERTGGRARSRSPEDEITAVSGSTRLEAKKQRRREGREAGRRRAPIVSEAEFLARREAVDRVMAIRQRADVTQIAVLEDKVLVEHYVARESQTSLIGNVYLGRVQNVLPSMEAAFVDIGKGRNAVLYAGEVNWSALGHPEGQPRKIEAVLSPGQAVLVQVTKDPVGHKGARLTSQVSLAGRFLVYVPDGTTSGISRKLPDTERNRLKTLLKEIVPDSAGVIVRTAAEGAAEEDLTRDVERLKARWEDIEKKVAKGNSPQLLYGEPDLTLKVVRDLFTEDFSALLVDGDEAWETVHAYVEHVAPDLEPRLERYDAHTEGRDGRDLFAHLRIDEQIHKGLDRKVWLPSGGSLIIDRTEAMTVVDVNTGKFTGSGGNLEETVTKNNLEAAEEIVRQLRLRDIGGIIVVDFIDMVLESNRDLVLRRLVECLGRDRTRHQVAEVTSLGLVQMTRKRIGTGLLEAFSETCEHCHGRGLVVQDAPVEPRRAEEPGSGRSRRNRRGRGEASQGGNGNGQASTGKPVPSPRDVAAMARPDSAESVDAPALSGEPEESVAASEEAVEEALEALEGPPDGSPAESPEPDQDPQPAQERGQDPEQAPEVEAEEPAGEPSVESATPPAPPTVVTRTRRRAASRPAGPPVPVEAGHADGDAGGAEQAEPTGDDEEPPAVSHVPVKRKGRKR